MIDVKSLLVLLVLIYKLAALGVGSLFCYMGYRLFSKGIWGDAGTLHASNKSNKLLLKTAAPGTFFVVLGALIVGFTLIKGLHLSASYSPPPQIGVLQGPISSADGDGGG